MKNRFKIHDSRFMIRIFITLIVLFVFLLNPESLFLNRAVHAVDSTTSSVLAATQPQATQSNSLTDKLNDLKKEIASRAATLRTEVGKKLQNKSFFGLIEKIDGDTITLKIKDQSKTISSNEFTTFVSTVRNSTKTVEIKVEDLEEGEYISALGDIDDKNILQAKKVIKSTAPATDSSKLVWGTIQSVSSPNFRLKTTDQIHLVQTSSKTKFMLGTQEASFVDAKLNRTLIARVEQNSDGTMIAGYIYFIPSLGSAIPEKRTEATAPALATPSVSPRR